MTQAQRSARAKANWKRMSRKAKNVGMANAAFSKPLLA